MKKLSIIFLLLSPLFSLCQITIDSTHIATPGETRYFGDVVDDADLFLIGNSGTNQTWDFSTLIAEEEDSIVFMDPQNTPYALVYPSSNLCLSTSDILFYLDNDFDGLWLLGGVDQTIEPVPIEKEAILKYPLTYGSSFISKWELDTVLINNVIPLPGIDIIRYKLDSTENNYVDGWGILKLPMGNYDALRIKKTIISIDSLWGRPFPSSVTIGLNGNLWDPDSVWVNIGDTVFFNTGAYHNAVQVDSVTWVNGDTLSNGGFFFTGNTTSSQYIIIDTNIINTNGVIYYVCQPHASMGMIGRLFIKNPWNLIYNSSNGPSTNYWWVSDHQDAGITMLELELDNYGDIDFIRFMKQEKTANINNETNNIIIYPNPVSEKLFINNINNGTQIILKNIIGQNVINIPFINNIDVSKIENGIYYLEIHAKEKLISKTKIIINH